MGNGNRHILRKLLRAMVLAGAMVAMLSRCANTAAPEGGPRDSLPPVPVRMTPGNYSTNFTATRISIEFDEYVQLKDQFKEFYTSPRMKTNPVVTIRGRGVQIDIRDTLAENTTYALNFGSSIRDNNEGNPLNDFRYVFSTGDQIDSLVMSGYTVDAYKKDSVAKTFVYFYEAGRDSIAEYDSMLFNAAPDVVARAESNGLFIAQNLKPIDYRVYAMQDNNNNNMYEPGSDLVGFLDSTYNPINMPEFGIRYDTIRKHLVPEPQLYFRMFADGTFHRQNLSSTTRPVQHQIMLYFSGPDPQIESLTFEGIDSSQIITDYVTPRHDTISLWLNMPSEELPDSIRGEITYYRHDSLNELAIHTQQLVAAWKFIESNDQRRDREKKEKELEKAIEDALAAGEVPPRAPNPFKYRVDASNPLNPDNSIAFTFDYPLISIDSSRISLIRTAADSSIYRVRTQIEQDTVNIKRWFIKAAWQPGEKYTLDIPDSVFVNLIGETNDSLKSEFKVMHPDDYATIVMNVKGKTDTSRYVIQLMDGSGSRMLKELRDVTTGEYRFMYVAPGTVRLSVIEDVNGNGIWDKGNMIERRQPERVEVYMRDGEPDITVRTNWSELVDMDMNELFAPVTMERIIRQLEKEEAAFLEKYLEEQQKKQTQEQQRQQNQRQGSTFNPTDGFGL